LAACDGNVSEAARRLGVSRMTLRYRMEKHGLKGE
jgi:transcriptional regulator of acetoin/glycerol metabolism